MVRGFAAVTLACAAGLAAADARDVDTSGWTCGLCPFDSGRRVEYEVGAGGVSDDSAHVGSASGHLDEGAYANVNGAGSHVGDGHRIRWTGRDLGLDSRSADLQGGARGAYEYRLGYAETTDRRSITSETVFVESGADALLLPANWTTAPVTSGLSELDANLVRRDIRSDRRTFAIGGRYRASSRLSLTGDYRRRDREGVTVRGGAHFTNASLLPVPFDHTTDELDLALRYDLDAGFVSLGWHLSKFDNDGAALSWRSPFTTFAGAEIATLARAPSSRFSRTRFAAGYRFAEYETHASFSAALGRIEQNVPLLPYTTNANISAGALPRPSLDGRVETRNVAFAVTSRIIDDAQLKLSYRYDERDNETARASWNRVIVDTFTTGDVETNVPYGFTRSSLSVAADYVLPADLKVSAGYDRRSLERDFQEVAEQDEDTGWGRARWRPTPAFEISVKAGASRRDIDRYNTELAAERGQNPLMRKYNLSYRYREFFDVTATVAPPESPLSLTLTGRRSDDSYTRSRLGLMSGEEDSVTADMGWTLSQKASLYLSAGIDRIDSLQAGAQSPGGNWRAQNIDEFETIGAGLRMRQISENVDLQLDYSRSTGTSSIRVDSAGDGSGRFPDLTTKLDDLRLKLTYARSERTSFVVQLRYQRFETEDWALQSFGPTASPVVLSLGADPYDEKVFVFGMGFRSQFGD